MKKGAICLPQVKDYIKATFFENISEWSSPVGACGVKNFLTHYAAVCLLNYILFRLQLNVLHWHITDTHSFPIKLEKFPNTTAKMAQFGAYGPNHIYTVDQVKDLVQYATERGR